MFFCRYNHTLFYAYLPSIFSFKLRAKQKLLLFLLDLYGSKDKLVLSFCKAMELFWLTTTHFSDNLHNKYKEEL